MGKYGVELVEGVGAQHGHTRRPEARDALEQGRSGQVPPYMEYAAEFVDALDALADLAAQHGELFGDSGVGGLAGLEI